MVKIQVSGHLRHIETLNVNHARHIFKQYMNIEEIKDRLSRFAEERDWEQFHSPKNLSMAIAAEAGELLEIFQWLTEEQSIEIGNDDKEMALIRQEIADIFIYLIRLADKLDVDIEQAIKEKIELNELKYPKDIAKGSAAKYNRL